MVPKRPASMQTIDQNSGVPQVRYEGNRFTILLIRAMTHAPHGAKMLNSTWKTALDQSGIEYIS